jgi:hypothetical protein
MESSLHCPNIDDCPVYQNNVSHSEMVGLTYRSLYCLQVNKKYKVCKRYHAISKFGNKVPRSILPNTLVVMDDLSAVCEAY